MTNYYVLTPFVPVTEEWFVANVDKVAERNQKVMAIVFNCKDYADFHHKWFND